MLAQYQTAVLKISCLTILGNQPIKNRNVYWNRGGSGIEKVVRPTTVEGIARRHSASPQRGEGKNSPCIFRGEEALSPHLNCRFGKEKAGVEFHW